MSQVLSAWNLRCPPRAGGGPPHDRSMPVLMSLCSRSSTSAGSLPAAAFFFISASMRARRLLCRREGGGLRRVSAREMEHWGSVASEGERDEDIGPGCGCPPRWLAVPRCAAPAPRLAYTHVRPPTHIIPRCLPA